MLEVKNPPANAGDIKGAGSLPRLGRPPGKGNGYPLQCFLPGEFHGQRSLVVYSPWDLKKLDTTEQLILFMSINIKYFSKLPGYLFSFCLPCFSMLLSGLGSMHLFQTHWAAVFYTQGWCFGWTPITFLCSCQEWFGFSVCYFKTSPSKWSTVRTYYLFQKILFFVQLLPFIHRSLMQFKNLC